MIEIFAQKVAELEIELAHKDREIALLRNKLQENDLDIIGLNHQLMLMREGIQCDPSECV